MTYSNSISLSRRQYGRRNQNFVAASEAVKAIGPISNTIILLFLACLIGLLYLTQVTKTNSHGYTINELQKQHSLLQSEKANLEVAAARLQSLDRIANSQVAKSLVSATPSGVVR
ncbi:MAG: hypothetical protein WD877_02920 [Candidatus Saccharimonadales bacterium]